MGVSLVQFCGSPPFHLLFFSPIQALLSTTLFLSSYLLTKLRALNNPCLPPNSPLPLTSFFFFCFCLSPLNTSRTY
ncbi:hypothetical protein BJX65DRAFT_280594 [Aspergillus insuetus]